LVSCCLFCLVAVVVLPLVGCCMDRWIVHGYSKRDQQRHTSL
jgi:hypothetical protein